MEKHYRDEHLYKNYMEKHFPFRPEEVVLLNSESLSTRKKYFLF